MSWKHHDGNNRRSFLLFSSYLMIQRQRWLSSKTDIIGDIYFSLTSIITYDSVMERGKESAHTHFLMSCHHFYLSHSFLMEDTLPKERKGRRREKRVQKHANMKDESQIMSPHGVSPPKRKSSHQTPQSKIRFKLEIVDHDGKVIMGESDWWIVKTPFEGGIISPTELTSTYTHHSLLIQNQHGNI